MKPATTEFMVPDNIPKLAKASIFWSQCQRVMAVALLQISVKTCCKVQQIWSHLLILIRSEKAAVNSVRFLAELFKQPTLRESSQHLKLLLPPLLVPLLEALCPE